MKSKDPPSKEQRIFCWGEARAGLGYSGSCRLLVAVNWLHKQQNVFSGLASHHRPQSEANTKADSTSLMSSWSYPHSCRLILPFLLFVASCSLRKSQISVDQSHLPRQCWALWAPTDWSAYATATFLSIHWYLLVVHCKPKPFWYC